jgi:hypothetical protein
MKVWAKAGAARAAFVIFMQLVDNGNKWARLSVFVNVGKSRQAAINQP